MKPPVRPREDALGAIRVWIIPAAEQEPREIEWVGEGGAELGLQGSPGCPNSTGGGHEKQCVLPSWPGGGGPLSPSVPPGRTADP